MNPRRPAELLPTIGVAPPAQRYFENRSGARHAGPLTTFNHGVLGSSPSGLTSKIKRLFWVMEDIKIAFD
jgi:hypothetical protein